MKQLFLFAFLLLTTATINAQIVRNGLNDGIFEGDSTKFSNEITVKLDGKTKYTDYKAFTFERDSTVIDTTLTILKEYKFNFIRKDDFELLPFSNLGSTYNTLSYNNKTTDIFPDLGVNAKKFNYKTVNDIYYYYVPTPTSELMYKTAMEQGQVLDAFITANPSKQLNVSAAYKGLRSLGKYRNELSSHGNFRTTFNYTSKNKLYKALGHFYSYDFLNQQNGGLTKESIAYFKSGNKNYTDRARLETNFTDAENMFRGKRYFLNQEYTFISKRNILKKSILLKHKKQVKLDSIKHAEALSKMDSIAQISFINKVRKKNKAKKDSLKTKLSKINSTPNFEAFVGNTFMYETNHYTYNQANANSIFGESYNSKVQDHYHLKKLKNEVYGGINSKYTGKLKAKFTYFKYTNLFNNLLFTENNTKIPQKLKGNAMLAGADWDTKYGKLHLKASAESIFSGNINGNKFKGTISYKKDSAYALKASVISMAKTPDFNKTIYHSDYKAFNWYNNFKNIKTNELDVTASYKNWISVNANFNTITDFVYLDENATPKQANQTISYLKIKAQNTIKFWKFSLENTLLYQNISNGKDVLRVPTFVTRNSLYYTDYLFKGKPMYLQTGFTFKYFTKYKANAYHPVLGEFHLQNHTEIGNFPIVDFFANAQVRRTRLYLKVENITASFTGRKYYAAPLYPYRDLIVRFGLVWNFFI